MRSNVNIITLPYCGKSRPVQTLGYYFFLSEGLGGIVACITTSDKVMRLLQAVFKITRHRVCN